MQRATGYKHSIIYYVPFVYLYIKTNYFLVTAVVIGGKKSTIETFVPGLQDSALVPIPAACYTTLTTASLPSLTNPITYYDAMNTKLIICGKDFLYAKFGCYSLTQGETKWIPVALTNVNVAQIPARYISFLYNKQLWIVGDMYPKILDLVSKTGQDFWDTASNLPTIPTAIKSDGAGCAIVVGDLVYLFGGQNTYSYRRFYLKGLGVGITGDGARKWEYLGEMPGVRVLAGGCAALPNNRNQILLEDSTTNLAYIYDIYLNTFTKVLTTIDFAGGTPINELCHNSLLYVYPIGTGTSTFSPPALTKGSNWVNVPSAGSIAGARYNPVVVMVPKAFIGPSTTCTGC
jgi:hypothetical protein